ncbi:MAG: type II toxin-antitoxin system RelE/ParE family toxin [Deltaproteobacteria bacterium]|nr:type II toxin-antitoxin system RelE/ParE family toxin [Deltaproteobacteria bacterium]
MKYQVHFFSSAVKEFQKLPKDVQEKVLHVMDMLRIDPYSEVLKIRKLKGGEDLFRIRIGNYRLIYKIESSLSLLVVRIRHRKDVYENL